MPPQSHKTSTPRPSPLHQTKQPLIRDYSHIVKAIPRPKSATIKPADVGSQKSVDQSQQGQTNHTSTKRKRVDEGLERDSPDAVDHEPTKRTKTRSQSSARDKICATPTKSRSNPQNLPTPDTTPTKPLSPRTPQSTPSRGQQRLLDIKSLVADAQKAQAFTDPVSIPDSPSNRKAKELHSRSSSLYDRLKAKAVERAKAPPPPSAEIVARRNALQRLPDVVRVLAMPAAKKTQARGSYSLKAIIGRVQQSARCPMGSREVERCLRLLSDEAEALDAVGFLSFLKTGKMEAVTVDARYRPVELEERVAELVKRSI